MTEMCEPRVQRPQIRDVSYQPERIVHQVGLVHSADHDRVVHTHPAEDFAPTAHAEETDIPEGRAQRGQLVLVLAEQAQAVDDVTVGTQPLGDEYRQAAAACDQPDRGRRGGRVGADRE